MAGLLGRFAKPPANTVAVVAKPVAVADTVDATVADELVAEPEPIATGASVDSVPFEAAPAEPVMEELIGWRQKSLEPRPERPKRHKLQREPKPYINPYSPVAILCEKLGQS